jgi:hypothetical protein
MKVSRFARRRKSYARYRKDVAMERLLETESEGTRRLATRWAIAWGVACGEWVPVNFRLRPNRQ